MRSNAARWSPVLLRLGVGLVMVVHGLGKLDAGPLANGVGVAGFEGLLTGLGVPVPVVFAWVVTLVELLGGIALLIGLFVRYAATMLAVDMAVATVLVHLPNGFGVGTGGIEFTLMLALASISLVLSGAGALSLELALFGRELGPTRRASGRVVEPPEPAD